MPTSIASAVSTFSEIENDIENEILHPVKTEQENQASLVSTPRELPIWHPLNFLTVEDTPFSKRVLIHLLVLTYSIPGNLCRFSIQSLTEYSNAYINYPGTVLWCNFTACLVMSFCNNAVGFWTKVLDGSQKKSMKEIGFHTAITSGFCGSFSTFSSMLIEILYKTSGFVKNGELPNGGYGVMEFFSTLIINISVPLIGQILGQQLAIAFDKCIVPRLKWLSYKTIRVVELCSVVIGFLAVIVNIVLLGTLNMSHWYKQRYAFSILMGLFGAWCRFFLSRYNGKPVSWFPLGTFLANFTGSLLVAVCDLLSLGLKNGQPLVNGDVNKMILLGFSNGWAGSLSTISSFINELYNLRHPGYQQIYFWVSFSLCFTTVLLVNGCYGWTEGLIKK